MNNPFKIVCFGDSTTDAGFKASEPWTATYDRLKVYSQWLEELLPDILNKKIKVVNKGVSGDTTFDARLRFQQDVLDEQPDLVIIQFGVNDQVIRQDFGLKQPQVSLDQFVYMILFFVYRIRKTGAEVILMSPGMLLWNDDFKKRFFENPYYMDDRYGLNNHLIKYIEKLKMIAEKEEIPFIDVFREEMDYDKKKDSIYNLLPDGLHPNSKGHQFISDLIINHIKQHISYEMSK